MVRIYSPNIRSIWRIVKYSLDRSVSWKSRVIGFGHAELDIGDADTAEIA
jgi:hypothetical protein